MVSSYLISIAVENAAKAKFYNEDIPALEDVSTQNHCVNHANALFRDYVRLTLTDQEPHPHEN